MAACFYFGVCTLSRQRKKSQIHRFFYFSVGKPAIETRFIQYLLPYLSGILWPFMGYFWPMMTYWWPVIFIVPVPKWAPVTETVSPVYLIHLTFSHTTSGSLKDGQPCSIDSLYQSVYLENRISISHNLWKYYSTYDRSLGAMNKGFPEMES